MGCPATTAKPLSREFAGDHVKRHPPCSRDFAGSGAREFLGHNIYPPKVARPTTHTDLLGMASADGSGQT
jgi:hypothetical protein